AWLLGTHLFGPRPRAALGDSAMDAELLELQRQFESAQQAKPSVRLSERNVVELVQKLHELRIIDFDLLHTVSGKEYITPDQLRLEMETEIKKLGRVSLIDLSDVIGVDLYYIERQAENIVVDDPRLMLVNGEIISQSYWDTVAEEINEKLQECSQMSLAEIAAQLQIGSELVVSVLEPRLGTLIKGRLEGGQLYTPAHVSRITAMVRGAARGITVPTNLPSVWSSLQQLLQDIGCANSVSVDGTFFQSLFNGLLKEGEILGSLRAGVQWTPAVFGHAQRESVDSFFSQNSYIGYDVLHKLAIPQPKQYLQSRYPEGILLDAVFVHPSMVEMLDASIEDAVEHGNWIDALTVLPTYVGGQDASKILSLCPSLQRAIKSSQAIIFGESCVFSSNFVKDLFERLEKEMDTLSYMNLSQGLSSDVQSTSVVKVGVSAGQNTEQKEIGDDVGSKHNAPEKGGKKKKGKHTGSAKAGASEDNLESQENLPSKFKKNQRKNKNAGSLDAFDAKSISKKSSGKSKDDSLDVPSEDWIKQKILLLAPELEELGGPEDPHALLGLVSSHLRPMLVNSWMKRRDTVVLENAEKRRKLLDNLQRQLDEVFLDLQLYEKALDLFEDDPPLSVILHKHLLRTMATPLVDKILTTLDMENKLKNGIEIKDSENVESTSFTFVDRVSLAKGLPNSLSVKAQAVAEALEGKRLDTFMNALRDVVEESGLLVKKLDKKLERTMLHSHRKDLTSQVSSESDPVKLLPKVVALLYMQVYNKALQAPGRAISALISQLKDKLPDSTYKTLMDYHSATVTLLALQAAAVGDFSYIERCWCCRWVKDCILVGGGMAILKNDSRVSKMGVDSSPGSRGSASSQEDDEEPRARSGKAVSDASDSSDVDSGMESDEFDPAELGEPETQLCQVGNQSCSILLELFDLPDLGSVLSLDTWNECLSEEERFALAEYLPDMDRETFGFTLKELFLEQNFHFGSPLGNLFNRLKGGLCDPRIVLYCRGLSFLQQHEHYHCLCKYQNSMVRNLVFIKNALRNCPLYSIEERLRLLNIQRAQKPLSYGGNGDVDIETDSESGDSDDWYLNKRFKMGQRFAKPSFDVTHRGTSMAWELVKFGKEYSKGVLKVTTPSVSALENPGALGKHSSALKHGLDSKPRVVMPLLDLLQQDKFEGYDVGAAKRTKHNISDDHGDMDEGCVGSQVDWIAGCRRAVARNTLLRTGKKQEPQKRYDMGMDSDEDPEGYSGSSHSQGKSRDRDQVVTIALYGRESAECTRNAKYSERDWVHPTTGRAQKHMLTNPMQKNEHGEPISSGHSVKSDDWNGKVKNCKVGNEYKAGKSGAGYDLKNKAYKPVLGQMGDSFLSKDPGARLLLGKVKNNFTQYEGMTRDHSKGLTMISQSEETESDSSDQVEDDGSLDSMPNKLMKVDRKSYSDLRDVGRSICTPDVESCSVKGKNSRLVKKALVPRPSEKSTYIEKRHKRMANVSDSLQQSFYTHDYGSGMMDEYMENLDEISKSQGDKNIINRVGNMMEVSDVLTINPTQERSNMPLEGCNSVSKKPKRKVDGHLSNELDISLHLLPSQKQQIDDLNVVRKGKRKADAETDTLTEVTSDMVISEKDTEDVEPKPKLQKKPFTLITPTIHTGFLFSIIHLLSAVRKAMITPHIEDTSLTASHLEDGRSKQKTEEHNKMHQVANGTHLSQSHENMDKHSPGYAGQNSLPSLTVQEIVDQVRSNPGDPFILETQEPLQDLIRGVLKVFSSKTAPLGAKGWKPLALYEKSNKSWLWAGPVTSSSSDNDNAEEETSSEAWGIPHKMLVKLVDAFANWLKSGQVTLQQIGSLPPPPPSLLSNLDEKERFKDLRAQKSLNTISPSSDEVRVYFRREEFLRYSVPDRAFSYTAADGKKSIVAPLRRGGGKPTSKARDHFMLKPDRPPHVTILCLVRDSAARLPGSIGTRADVCTLLRDSQYIVENISDAQVNQVVSGALDRLHYERDPCVQFDSERKLWVYLHKDREEEDFEDDGTSSTKKWKRQRKDSIDPSDIGAVNDVDTGVLAIGGSSVGLDHDHDHDLIVETSSSRVGEKVELVCEDMGPNMENVQSLMASTTVSKSHSNWEDLGSNPLREKRLICQENSTDEDFDDETFSQERPMQLQYDRIMKNGLY
ncbi:unnamed protein product, partial [Musa banksii]